MHDHAAAGLRVTDAVEHPVACVVRLTLDIHLRDQTPLPWHMDGKMNVRRPTRIRYRPDGAEPILSVFVHLGAAIALEGMVDAPLPGCAGWR